MTTRQAEWLEASKPPGEIAGGNRMHNLSATSTNLCTKPGDHLLDKIMAMRVDVGDVLNDHEFTRLLLQAGLPGESGFAFLSYCDRFATLSVPRHELSDWYPEAGWILPAKEKIARAVGDKYGFSVCVPPDGGYPFPGSSNPHHHLELSNHLETIVIVHPLFLKIRLFLATDLTHDARNAKKPLLIGDSLLEDLSALFRG